MGWFKRNKSMPAPAQASRLPARRPLAMALEPRVMFDGAAAVTAAAQMAPAHAEAPARADIAHHSDVFALGAVHASDHAMRWHGDRDADVAVAAPARDVLFVDARVEDAATLLAHVRPGTEVVYLQQGRDGLEQMRDYLDAHQGVASVQILAHGNDGDLWLGSTYLSADNIGQYASELQQIGADIKTGGDILIYACDTAAGDKGMAFVGSLSDLTHRDVAASSDRTGAGSDWNLEISTGHIEAAPVLAAVDEAAYGHDLAIDTVTNANDSGAGSLRATIASATAGDTITFSSGFDIKLSTHDSGDTLLLISKNLTIEGDINGDGTADVTLDGQYNGRVLEIAAGATVSLDGLIIEHGLLSGNGGNGTSTSLSVLNGGDALGAGIFNAGTLTLSNVTVTGNRGAGGGGASFTPNNNVYGSSGATYGFGGGGGGGYAGVGGGDGGAANITGSGGAAGTLGGGGLGGTGGQSFDYGGHGYGGGGGSTTGGTGAYQISTLGGGSGGTAGSIGGGGGGWGNTGGASGRGGNAVGGIYNAGTLTVRNSTITNNAGAGGGGAGSSFEGGSTYVAGAGGVAAGAILNAGTLQIDGATIASFSGNAAQGGERGQLGGSDPSHPAATSDADYMDLAGGTTTVLPSVSGVSSSTANGTYGPGDVITITVTFSEAVNVTGTPQLILETGTTDRVVNYVSGSGTSTLSFSYTVQTGDSSADLDYESSSALTLNGGTIKSAGGGDASLTLASPGTAGSLGASKDIVVVPSLATITSATYDASTGVLTVTGTNMTAGDTIDVGKLTLSGEGGTTYTLTSSDVTASSSTGFSVTLNSSDRAAVDVFLNKNGTSSTGGTTFNLAAAADWDVSASAGADLTNGVTVSNVAVPAITSATYDASTGTVVVTGTGFLSLNGATNDIVANKFTFTGEGGATYTLTDTANVDITSGTSFTLLLSATDRAAIDQIVNKNGTSSTSGTTYNLAAAEDWDSGADAAVVVADTTGNGITASNVAVPTITSATYDASTGTVVVTGTGFLSLSGASNDIVANKFTFTGEGGATYTLTDTANVDITSGTSFTLLLSATDRAAIDQLIVNKNGTSSTSGTTYNLAAAEDWAAGADAAVVTADTTGNGITVSNVAVPTITSATYDASNGTVVVTGTGFLSLSGASNDIIANKFTFTGEGGSTYTLTNTANVDITSGTSFTLTLSATDLAGVNAIIDKSGTSSIGGTTYNLAAAEDWAAGADAAVVTADTTGNGITAGNVNASPVVTTDPGSASFVAGDNTASTPVVIDSGLTVSDADTSTLASATVSITGGFHSGEDVLSFVNDGSTMGNITASYNATTGVLTLTSAGATATLAQWQSALDSVTYTDTAITPNTATRTISFTANDGNSDSAAATRTITVTATDQTPIVTTTGGTTSYIGGTAATTIDGGISVSDLDNTTQSSGTVSINAGFHSGDVLAFTNDGATMGNIAASYNAATGVLTLTSAGATATDAQWANALSSVTFSSTSTTYGNRTIAFATSDGAKTSVAATDTVDILAPPTLTTDSGSASFVAGDNTASTPVAIDSGLTVTDGASTTLSSATVALTGGFHSGEDVLAFTNDGATMGNISASYNAATGVLTLTSSGATATLAQWQSALDSVTYTDTAITPNTTTRTVSFTAVDGGGNTSNTATRTITVTATDQTPIVTTTGGTTNYVGGTSAVTIDGGISVSDLDNTTQSSATVAVNAGFHSGDTLTFVNTNSTTFGNIVGSYNAATGVLTLASSGATATDAQWANALSSVTFSSTSTTYGNRTIAFATSDGTKTSVAATDTVDVLGPPQITTDSGSASFVAGDNTASTPVVIDGGLTVTDGSSTTFASTTIAITGGFHSGEDVLSFVNDGSTMGNITASYNATTGVLTLTSAGATATLAQWQSALDSVTYTDTAITPNTTTRTVSFTAVDGGGTTSNTATRTITVTATDQTPIVTTTGGTTSYIGGSAATTIDGGITVSDLDDTTQSSATVSIGSGFHSGDILGFVNTSSAIYGNIVASYNAATGVMTLTSAGATATDAQWANALSAVTFSSTSTTGGDRTIAFVTNDGVKTSAVATDTVAMLGQPVVTDVSSTAPDGSYKIGDTIYLTITFDQTVTVDTSGGTPTLLMETGSIDHNAAYISGSGSNTLTFAYTVQAGDASSDLDYASTAALALNGGTIRGSGGYDAVTTLPTPGGAASIAGQHAIVVDGIAPTVASVAVPANGTYVAGQNLDFTVNYSEAVTVDTSGGTPRIAITLDTGGTVYADYVSGSGTTALVFRYTVASGQADSNGITLGGAIQVNGGSIRDGVGNAETDTLNAVASTSGVLVDAVAPTANIVVADTALKAGETSQITITFSEAVSGLTTADFTVDNGALSGLVSTDGGITWTATLTPTADLTDASNVITLDNTGVQDAVGNAGVGTTASNNYAIDTLRPTASIVVADTALNAGETSQVTITFSEAVSGLTTADFTVAHGTLSGLSSSDGGITWTATLTPTVDVTDASNVITLDNTGVQDASGNPGTGTTISNSYAIDTGAPVVSAVVPPAEGDYLTGQQMDFTVRFSEAVFVDTNGGTPRIAIELDTGGTVYADYVSGSGSDALVFRLTVQPDQRDTNGIALDGAIDTQGGLITDVAGNAAGLALDGVGSTSGLLVNAIASPVVLLPEQPTDSGVAIDNGPSAPDFMPLPLLDTVQSRDLPTIFFEQAAPALTIGAPIGRDTPVLAESIGLHETGHAWLQPEDRSPVFWAAVEPGRVFHFNLPVPAEVLRITRADGTPAPAWLSFDPVTGALSGTVPRDFSDTALQLTVRDAQGQVHEVPLELSSFLQQVDKPAHPRSEPPAGDHGAAKTADAKVPLHLQFGRQRNPGTADHADLLRQLAVARQHAATEEARP